MICTDASKSSKRCVGSGGDSDGLGVRVEGLGVRVCFIPLQTGVFLEMGLGFTVTVTGWLALMSEFNSRDQEYLLNRKSRSTCYNAVRLPGPQTLGGAQI